jgi:hypothetical protein
MDRRDVARAAFEPAVVFHSPRERLGRCSPGASRGLTPRLALGRIARMRPDVSAYDRAATEALVGWHRQLRRTS